MGVRIPPAVAQLITAAQIVQVNVLTIAMTLSELPRVLQYVSLFRYYRKLLCTGLHQGNIFEKLG